MQPERVGPYTLLRPLGTGPLGRVALARTDKGARVALKVFRPELAGFPGFGERLRVEIDATARVRGPRVAAVLDADPDADVPWLASEYVPGRSLHEVVALHGPLPVGALRTIGVGLAEALLTIHGAGVVHGDLKPGNVLLTPEGPWVTDVGLARAAAATPLTRHGALVGTLGYLAPEQVVDVRTEPASDVFALGAVLLLAATWRRPFGEGDAVAVLHRVLHGHVDLRGVPLEVAGVVRECLGREPARRPGPEQVRAALVTPVAEAVPADCPDSGPTTTPPSGATAEPPATLTPTPPEDPRPGPGRGRRLASTAAVTVVLTGVLAVTTSDTIAVPPPRPPFAGLVR